MNIDKSKMFNTNFTCFFIGDSITGSADLDIQDLLFAAWRSTRVLRGKIYRIMVN